VGRRWRGIGGRAKHARRAKATAGGEEGRGRGGAVASLGHGPPADPGLGFVKVWPIGRFDGGNRERERRRFKEGDQQGRAPSEFARSWPAAEVEKRQGREAALGSGSSLGRQGFGAGIWELVRWREEAWGSLGEILVPSR
jgi:hypothetical protein